MYKKETLSRAETTYSDSFFVLRPQLCDSWCLLPAGTKLMHQLHCFLWKTLFCTPQFCFVCSMATCLSAGQGLSVSRLLRTSESLRWFCAIRKRSASLLSSDGSVAILQSTSVWQPLHFMHLHRAPVKNWEWILLWIGATCQQMACNSGLFLIVCCFACMFACIVSFRFADLSDSF